MPNPQQQQIQIQFKLTDVQQVQFVTLTNEWPEGELQVSNSLNFSSDTSKRIVRCTAQFEYKKNDITQLILSVQTSYEFAIDSWSAMYNLNDDAWVLPAGLLQHISDITIGASRGILAVRTQEAGFPRLVLPIVNPAQIIKNNLSLKRPVAPEMK